MLVIENGLVVPRPGASELLEGGSVVIDGDRIAAVNGRGRATDGGGDGAGAPNSAHGDRGPSGAGAAGSPAGVDVRIDAAGCAVLPGLVSCHAHFRPFRGLGDGLGMMAWHDRWVHRFSELMTPEDAYWGALNTFVEMLTNGVTTVQGMSSITTVEATEIAAATDSGIRARLVPHVHTREHIESTIERIQAEQAGGADRVRTWLGFEVPQIVDQPTLRLVAEASERLGVFVHTHFSEFAHDDVRPMLEAGLFRRGLSLAHCVHVSDDDIALMAEHGVAVSHNPRSNSRYGNGVAPLRALLDGGVTVGLGTDGPDSTFSCDVLEEARVAAFLARATARDATALSADEALGLATAGGAATLGMEGEIGELRPGARADVVIVDLASPSVAPVLATEPYRNLVPVLVFGSGNHVRDVIVDGRVVVRDRRLQGLDERTVASQCQRRAERILAQM